MRRVLLAAAACLALILPVAAHAERLIDYSGDEATTATQAAERGITLAPLPSKGRLHFDLHLGAAVDQQVIRGGQICSAWKVRNPVSVLATRLFAAADRTSVPGPLAATDPTAMVVALDRTSTFSRCVTTGELKSRCITRVSLDGSTTLGAGAPQPFHVEHEEATGNGGFCEGLARDIGLVSRNAVIALIAQLEGAPAAS